jgi:hypothetical protein
MPRKKRSDSIEAAIEAAQKIHEGIQPPSYINLPDDVLVIWQDIIQTKALNTWTPNDLIQAATLARVYRDIQKYSEIVERTSRISKNGNGFNPNAAHKVLNDLVTQAQSLARSLQVHARATQGESRDQKAKNALYANARNKAAPEDDLLAKPRH